MLDLIEELVDAGHAYVVDGQGVYFDVDVVPRTTARCRIGASSSSSTRPGSRRGRRREAQPDRLRALEGGQARRADVGLPVGSRASRLAHRVLGDVARPARRRLRSPRRRRRPGVPAQRERARPGRGRRAPVRPPLDPLGRWWRSVARRCRSRSATSARSPTRSTPTAPGRSASAVLQTHYRKAMELGDAELTTAAWRSTASTRSSAGAAAAAGVDRAAEPRRRRRRCVRRGDGRRLRDPGRSPSVFEAATQANQAIDAGRPRARGGAGGDDRRARGALGLEVECRAAPTPRSTAWSRTARRRAPAARLRDRRPDPRRPHDPRDHARGRRPARSGTAGEPRWPRSSARSSNRGGRLNVPRSQAGLGGEVVPGWRAVRELLVAKRRRVKKLLVTATRREAGRRGAGAGTRGGRPP